LPLVIERDHGQTIIWLVGIKGCLKCGQVLPGQLVDKMVGGYTMEATAGTDYQVCACTRRGEEGLCPCQPSAEYRCICLGQGDAELGVLRVARGYEREASPDYIAPAKVLGGAAQVRAAYQEAKQVACPRCQAKQPAGHPYCAFCGSPMDPAVPEPTILEQATGLALDDIGWLLCGLARNPGESDVLYRQRLEALRSAPLAVPQPNPYGHEPEDVAAILAGMMQPVPRRR
jgi:hypothetical protein